MEFENFDYDSIDTPVKAEIFRKLLKQSGYDANKTEYLLDGFKNGFDISYRGPQNRKDISANIPIREGVGLKLDMWNKVMKEVKLNRYAGPFQTISFENYMQSPIGLVPKAGNQIRLIFHLSYNFGEEEHQKSLNYFTPKELCSVK